jgi:Putative prokaryotic signal transducing protein
MSEPTPEQERVRIAGVYSAMSDEELGQIAASGDELNASAQEALSAEAAKRGLTIKIALPRGENVVEFNETVTLRQFLDLPEALLAKGMLESEGIQTYLIDENMVRLDWFISNILGGIKLRVRAEDAEAAREILDQPIPETLDVEGVGNFEQPKCPKCQSLDISFEELNKPVAYFSAYAGVPIPAHKRGWTCHACGNEWEQHEQEEDGLPPEPHNATP